MLHRSRSSSGHSRDGDVDAGVSGGDQKSLAAIARQIEKHRVRKIVRQDAAFRKRLHDFLACLLERRHSHETSFAALADRRREHDTRRLRLVVGQVINHSSNGLHRMGIGRRCVPLRLLGIGRAQGQGLPEPGEDLGAGANACLARMLLKRRLARRCTPCCGLLLGRFALSGLALGGWPSQSPIPTAG